jgi:hypothetical protein
MSEQNQEEYTPQQQNIKQIDIEDEFSVFHRKNNARLKFYNNNKYNISYYQDNEKIEYIKNNDIDEDCKEDKQKKPMFINDDD